ncbi:MAG: hypothetical protein IJ247_05650 [Bacilli bacterium]|nr:hypothetical protein [Bacilli bacterium]
MTNNVLVIGLGRVGLTLLSFLLNEPSIDTIALLDKDEKEKQIIEDLSPISNKTIANCKDLDDYSSFSFAFICVGKDEEIKDNREEYVYKSIVDALSISDELENKRFKGNIIIASNPHESIVTVFSKTNHHFKNVMGIGTLVDSFRYDKNLSVFFYGLHGKRAIEEKPVDNKRKEQALSLGYVLSSKGNRSRFTPAHSLMILYRALIGEEPIILPLCLYDEEVGFSYSVKTRINSSQVIRLPIDEELHKRIIESIEETKQEFYSPINRLSLQKLFAL